MDKNGTEYRELPLWVRLIVGRGWMSSSRRELCITEIFLVVMGTVLVVLSIANQFWLLIDDPKNFAVYASLLMFVFAYLVSVCIRVGDRYSVWPLLGHAKSRRFFGFEEKQ